MIVQLTGLRGVAFRSVCRHFSYLLATALFVSNAKAADIGDYFEDIAHPNANNPWQISVDSLFMFRTDDMSSVLMRDTTSGATSLQTGQFDLGTMVAPMVNIVKDGSEGWGVGFRYFSLLGGNDSSSRSAVPGERFTESFNGLDFTDLVQFDTTYSSTLHNVELNLRKSVRPGVTVFAGYRFIELNENFSIKARNGLPQEPAIEISNTNLTNQLHGMQLGGQATILQIQRFTLDGGGSAGLYSNQVSQTMFVRDSTNNLPVRTISDSQASFVSDINLTGVYRLRDHLAFRAGLQMMWLTDVALAPEQTQTNNFRTNNFQVNRSEIFYFGGFAGLQYNF